jgi:myosin-5
VYDQAAILYNLKLRHIREKPYTRTGDIVLAVNPYKWLDDLYTEKKQSYYSNRLVWELSESDPREQMEPHVYEVSALAYKGLAYEGEDQSILVSGESGAGKTETVKICLNHIAGVQRGHVPDTYGGGDSLADPVVRRVVESNPLLEAFGNAKTQRNDNSSRFGKYLQLQFERNAAGASAGVKSSRCGLVGSKCEVYLLEKNRVVGHERSERNYHIFYQLLSSPDSTKAGFWKGLAGKTHESFAYVGFTDTHSIEGKADADHFQDTLSALELVGIRGSSLNDLMRSICVVLQLGNLGFSGDKDHSTITTKAELSALAELMGVTEKQLTLSLTERTFATRDETHKVPLSADGAKEACDSLAKEVYQKAFLWLVNEINAATSAQSPARNALGIIGMLDIFGFEHFKVNRFEQLCINYANEKLQQKFTQDIFRNVQAEYEAEGLDLADIWYDDNTDVLDLIEGRTGLLALLNEECHRPQGNDSSFVHKALQQNKSSPSLVVHRTDQLSFGIQHYAGIVMYDADMFVSKNLDTLPTDLQTCAESSSNPIIKQPRSEPVVRIRSSSPLRGMRSHKSGQSNIVAPTVWTKYKTQLHSLMNDLKKTRSRYIRCIKPNAVKKPTMLEHGLVVDQLRSAGVIAGIMIARSVFPNRLDNAVVLARYSGMWDHRSYPSRKTRDMDPLQQRVEDCKALMEGALKAKETVVDGKVVKAFCVGRTRTYFRAGVLEWLESNRMRGLDAQAITIQKYARGWLVRNQGNNQNERARFAEAERERKRQEELAYFERLKQESFERQQEMTVEQQKLKARVAELLGGIRSVAEEGKRQVDAIKERQRETERECEQLKEQTDDDARKAALEPKMILAQQNKKLEEMAKIIKMLKRENKTAREHLAKVQGQHGVLADNCHKLSESCSNLGEQFNAEEPGAIRVSDRFESLGDRLSNAKADNRDYKSKVSKMQDQYMEQAQARLNLQKAMAKILRLIQDGAGNPDVVEETVVIALECESDCKAEMAALEAQTSFSSGLMADVSEASFSEGEEAGM